MADTSLTSPLLEDPGRLVQALLTLGTSVLVVKIEPPAAGRRPPARNANCDGTLRRRRGPGGGRPGRPGTAPRPRAVGRPPGAVCLLYPSDAADDLLCV